MASASPSTRPKAAAAPAPAPEPPTLYTRLAPAPMRITVSDPELRTSTFSKFVTYAVASAFTTLRRRYSDFVWLRETLVVHYPGAAGV